ncbi:hypothetical protein KC19_11G036200 [Ceratodon purpureus]|uniref:Glycosyltransferase 61 catalytic domain-containing protein n=1 Tax=Ceratodon purpureus TaxID=3225 RepID=A0A8T0GAK5_CERPU|nr:hypothetical protein KC19_11G036200 [Ceratodon purpureus]
MEMHPPGSGKRRKRGRGKVGREVWAWMAERVEWVRVLAPSFSTRVSVHHLVIGSLVFLLLTTIVFLLSPESLPGSIATYYQSPVGSRSCPPSTKPYVDAHAYCTGECNTECFPRVRNICFASDKVRLCDDPGSRSDLPKFMRFFGESLTVPVERDTNCNIGWHWVSGFSLVMDQRWLPAGKPNPHHEAEKLIPAILLKQFLNQSANLQWFAAKMEVSRWGKGLLSAFDLTGKVRYHALPIHKDDSICFKDAVLFSAPTHVRYVPDGKTNAWLRSQVLSYCKIEPRNASWPLSRAIVLDRSSGPRKLANKLDAGKLMEKLLQVPVEHRSGGIGSFCEQVRSVAEDDFFVVPHGSQNVNFLFARPGAVVIEVFPYLYHTDAFRNFTHAADIDVLPLLGAKPDGMWLRLASLLGWDGCFHWQPCKNYVRLQPLQIDLVKLEQLIRVVQKKRSSLRAELGW